MPELPDVTVYVEALERFVGNRVLQGTHVTSPFVLRTFDPPLSALHGKRVVSVHRIGKRIVLGFEGDVFVVVHLMIAGRFHWKKPGAALNRKNGLLSLDFADGSLFLTEASTKKRASVHVVRGRDSLRTFEAGGVEPLEADLAAFSEALRRENHTIKRALTDPTIVSGIGNAYSDEILHRARLSPMLLTQKMSAAQLDRLFLATREVLTEWIVRLRSEARAGFPEKVTAFHEEMAVHGRHGKACPVCGSPVQRIVRSENEFNYCATCQTDGRLLADRALSRLLKEDFPRTLEELERRMRGAP